MLFSDRETKRSQYYEEIYSVVEERWLDVHKTEIDWVDGRKVAMCTLYDITEKKIYQKEIENQANNDFLTGLFNRMRCEQIWDSLYERPGKKMQQERCFIWDWMILSISMTGWDTSMGIFC